ncbi:MAG: DUF488 domain-containing protein [Thermomonas sp.]
MSHDALPIFTIGHSTRPLGEFLCLLAESDIDCVVDVRRLPGSRAYPQYDADALRESLQDVGIDYWHLSALAGLRRTSEAPKAFESAFWTNASFRRYAAYAHTANFADGLHALELRAASQRCALMCAEAVWWRCHRRIIADYLLAGGHRVLHIMGPGKVMPAELTAGARIVDGAPCYPDEASPQLSLVPGSSTAS